MKKLLVLFFILFIGLPVLLLAAVQLSWTPVIEPKIRQTVQELTKESGVKIHWQKLSLRSLLLPVKLEATQLSISDALGQQKVKVPTLRLTVTPSSFGLSLASLAPHVDLVVVQPMVEVSVADAEKSSSTDVKKSSNQNPAKTLPTLPPISLRVLVEKGELKFLQFQNDERVASLHLTDWAFDLQSPNFSFGKPGTFDTSGRLHYEVNQGPLPLKGETPLKMSAKQWIFNGHSFALKDFLFNLGGLESLTTVDYQLNSGDFIVNSKAEVKNLSTLQKEGLLPAGKWSGGLSLQTKIEKRGEAPPLLEGRFRFDKVQGQLAKKIKIQDSIVAGAFMVNGYVDYGHQKQIKKLQGQMVADFTNLAVLKKGLIYKRMKTPLRFQLVSAVNNGFIQLKKFQIEFDKLKALVSGVMGVEAGQASDLQLEVAKTNLDGIEKTILPLKDYPVRGNVAFKGRLQGDWTKPDNMNVNLNPLSLNVASGVTYHDKENGRSLSGPFQVALNGNLTSKNQDIQAAQLNGSVDLSKVKIAWGDLISKTSQQSFNFKFSGTKQGDRFAIKDFLLKSFLGDLSLKGTIKNIIRPQLNTQSTLKNFDLGHAKKIVKPLSNLPVDGIVNAQFQLQGVFDSKLGIEKSPLKIKGYIQHQSSQLIWKSPKTVSSPKKASSASASVQKGPLPPPATLLPQWPVLKTADIGLKTKIAMVNFNGLVGKDFTLSGHIKNGVLTGDLGFSRILSGSLKILGIQSDLYKVPTFLQGQANSKNLDIASAIDWGAPEQKGLAKGALSGVFKVKAPFPSHGDVLKQTVSSGKLRIVNFEVSTLKLDQMVNGILDKIPGLKNKKKVKTKDIQALFQSDYTFSKGVLTFKDLDFLTPEDHQLLANGQFNVDKNLNLKGRLFVSGIHVKQEVEACFLDSKKRLEIPIEYHGLITAPKMTYATKAIEQVGKNYLKCESQRELKKVKQKAKKEVEKVIKKEGEKLQESLKKKLKDFF